VLQPQSQLSVASCTHSVVHSTSQHAANIPHTQSSQVFCVPVEVLDTVDVVLVATVLLAIVLLAIELLATLLLAIELLATLLLAIVLLAIELLAIEVLVTAVTGVTPPPLPPTPAGTCVKRAGSPVQPT
jgi:hypothetical protein